MIKHNFYVYGSDKTL